MSGTWGEYLSFRRMITPVFIQVIFWIFVAFAVIGGIAVMANGSVVEGLAVIIFGPLVARIYAEILIIIFRINDNVSAIARGMDAGSPSTQVAPPAARRLRRCQGVEEPGATQPEERQPFPRPPDDPPPPN